MSMLEDGMAPWPCLRETSGEEHSALGPFWVMETDISRILQRHMNLRADPLAQPLLGKGSETFHDLLMTPRSQGYD